MTLDNSHVTVMGAGAFGTALAVSIAERGPLHLWARDQTHVRQMIDSRMNAARLPDVAFPDTLIPTHDLPPIVGPVLLAVPMQRLRQFLVTHRAQLENAVLVACCKGIEMTTGCGPMQVLAQVMGADHPVALLTGPSFAHDIARRKPTALTIACRDDDLGRRLQQRLSTTTLRLYRTTDTVGAELGGAFKNIIAIAAGAAIGARLGDSARAAVMTRGFAEMQRYSEARGARPDTLMGLSGFGDLVLTCTSDLSRNYRLGLSLGRQEQFDPSITVEGAATAQAVAQQADEQRLDMPISCAVAEMVQGRLTATDAIANLLARPLREE
jgi:glycerol-3-phosphate dehydrogenase (NAD(P)+)